MGRPVAMGILPEEFLLLSCRREVCSRPFVDALSFAKASDEGASGRCGMLPVGVLAGEEDAWADGPCENTVGRSRAEVRASS